MKHENARKGAKFGAQRSMKASDAQPAESRFEIDIPAETRAMIAAEQKAANEAIENYVRRQNADLDTRINYLLRGALSAMPGIPKGINLRPSEDYKKLVEQ